MLAFRTLLVLVLLGACGGTRTDAATDTATATEDTSSVSGTAAQAEQTDAEGEQDGYEDPVSTTPDWEGAFSGNSSDGSSELGLVVQDGGFLFVVNGPQDVIQCTGRPADGIQSSMYRVPLNCGDEMALAGVDTRVSLFWSGSRWRVDGSGAFSGLNGVLERR